jgi:nucleotide-binding universal stress UspA family protein
MSRDALRILVPVDGSPGSEAILPALLPLVRSRPSEITLLRVVEEPDLADAARAALHHSARGLLLDGIRAVSRLEWGRPADEIDYLARPIRHDLLAMATHGRAGLRRAFLGSTAEDVLRRARIPVLLNRPGGGVGDWTKIVLALDGSPLAEDVLQDVEPLALALKATVHVLHVTAPNVPEPDLASVFERLAERGIPAIPARAVGAPAAGITRYLEESRAGLLAMTTHGRSGLARALAGSVAEDVIRSSPVPVLVRRAVDTQVLTN